MQLIKGLKFHRLNLLHISISQWCLTHIVKKKLSGVSHLIFLLKLNFIGRRLSKEASKMNLTFVSIGTLNSYLLNIAPSFSSQELFFFNFFVKIRRKLYCGI